MFSVAQETNEFMKVHSQEPKQRYLKHGRHIQGANLYKKFKIYIFYVVSCMNYANVLGKIILEIINK